LDGNPQRLAGRDADLQGREARRLERLCGRPHIEIHGTWSGELEVAELLAQARGREPVAGAGRADVALQAEDVAPLAEELRERRAGGRFEVLRADEARLAEFLEQPDAVAVDAPAEHQEGGAAAAVAAEQPLAVVVRHHEPVALRRIEIRADAVVE